MLARLGEALGDLAVVVRAARRSRVLEEVSLAGLWRFARDARGTPWGLHQTWMLRAQLHPDKECLADERGHRLRYGELDAAANRLAHALSRRGVTAGDRVATLLGNSLDAVIAMAALPRLGVVAVPIGTRLKRAEIDAIFDHAAPSLLLVDPRLAEVVAGIATPCLPTEAAPGWPSVTASCPATPPRIHADDAGGILLYTSGTTGKPKGATRPWRETGILAVADLIAQIGARSDDRHLVVCPLYHSAAPALTATMLALGASVVVAEAFDAERFLGLVAGERITSTLMVPTMLSRLCALPDAVLARHDLSSLRWVLTTAAPLPTALAEAFQRRFGPILWNFYGATETGMVTLAGPADHGARPGTIGRPLHGNRLRFLDDHGAPVATGQVGELYVANDMVIGAYHHDRDATAAARRGDYFTVGDLARVDDDGFVFLESRKHDMVISGGVNIYPREIEDRLAAHPAILEAAVVGVPDPEWGEALKAFVVLRPGHALSASEVSDWVGRGLAAYKRPKQVAFLDELPRNPTGKVKKRELVTR